MAPETLIYDNLLVGDDYVTDPHILIAGQNLKRGAALGMITASGKLTQLDGAKADGSQTPYGILAADVDATAADRACPVYKEGEFAQGSVLFIGSDTAATMKEKFRTVNIYLKATIPA